MFRVELLISSMIIGVDLRCLPSDGSPGAGVAHAARALTNKLIEIERGGVEWMLFLPRGASPQAEQRLLREKPAATRIVRIENASGAALRRSLKKYQCDLLFVPSGATPPGISIPVVPWVHDIAIFDHPDWFPEPFFHRAITTQLFRRGVMNAKRVLAVSEYTKQELVTHFSLPPEKITVTSEGGDTALGTLHDESLMEAKRQAKRRLAERGVTHPFILCMGTLEPRKNVPMLLSAWNAARARFRHPTDLVIAGRDGWKIKPIAQAIDRVAAAGTKGESCLHRIEMPNDDDRRDLLLAADVVAVPSLYEGFGLVALEAMQAGTAVLSSNAGALPEVIGDAAQVLSPEDVGAWTDALVRLCSDEAMRRQFAEQGKKRSHEMTWERSARIAFDILTKRSM